MEEALYETVLDLKQIQPEVTVIQPAPQPAIIQQQIQPEVTVIQPAPQPTIIQQQIQPEVTVIQPAPQPTIIQQQIQPEVTVIQPAPQPTIIQQQIQPEVTVIQPAPQPTIIQQQIQPEVTVIQPAPVQAMVQSVAVASPLVSQVNLRDMAGKCRCSYCQVDVITVTRYLVDPRVQCNLFGGHCEFVAWPCCLTPFRSCQDVEHSCPNCRNVLFVFKRH